MILKILFWIFTGIILYTYMGYTVILFTISIFKRKGSKNNHHVTDSEFPEVSLLIAAYNEKDFIATKMDNISCLDYPANKLKIIWVTDGSDDGTPELLKTYPEIEVYHQELKEGKSQAINRVMKFVKTPIVIFSDANTMLNEGSIRHMAEFFKDPATACVSGEKRITTGRTGNAVSAGEGAYWKYESYIKKLESIVNSTISGAGELLGLRTELFENIDENVINDDFSISLSVIKKGFKVKYSSLSFAIEKASLNIREEFKRKVRIATGGIQSLVMNREVLNPLKYGFYSFQFISHKVLRWTVVPFAFILIFILNLSILLLQPPKPDIYTLAMLLQSLFYLMVFAGAILQNTHLQMKILFLPFYLSVMNLASLKGILNYINGNYSASWEKAERMR